MRREKAVVRRITLYAVALSVTVVAVVAGVRLAADHTTAFDGITGNGHSRAPRPTAPAGPAPAPGQAFVTGRIDTLHAEGAQAPPMATPFTLTAVERGTGRATIANALVDGKRTSIVWPGGTPLPISCADGGIDLGGSTVDIDPGGATWQVDGSARALKPGRYRAGAPVAVGVGGLATPRDAVDFTADAQTVISSRGGVVVKVPPAPLELTGPGKVATSGQLQVRDSRATKPATSIQFGEGPYELTLTPSAGRFELDAVLQGPVTSG